MPDIFHSFTIKASAQKVFKGISTSEGLDNWWTKTSDEKTEIGSVYGLYFGEQYKWKAIITRYIAEKEFELQLTEADADWIGSKVGFLLNEKDGITRVDFYHTGWKENSDHFKYSSYCWAMYLRILKRYVEFGEQVAYEKRLSV